VYKDNPHILIGSKFQDVEFASGPPLAGPSVHINVTASGSTGKHASSGEVGWA